MAGGLLALLDDVALIARTAASSADDVAAMTAKTSAKAAGVVIDDAAVTPQYVRDVTPARELPMIWRIAKGSFRNKLLFILPIALLLNAIAPWALVPILMIGGAYLCFEGAEKILHKFFSSHDTHENAQGTEKDEKDEDALVSGAIRTDLILSAEIMTIALNEVSRLVVEQDIHGPGKFAMEAAALAFVAVIITVGAYGFVALIVKADDYGVALVRTRSGFWASAGRALVRAMPGFMKVLTVIGTAAMIWVGGNIVIHGLHELGYHAPYDFIHAQAERAAHAVPAMAGAVNWFVTALIDGIFGLALGLLLIPLSNAVIAPLWRAGQRAVGKA